MKNEELFNFFYSNFVARKTEVQFFIFHSSFKKTIL